MCGAHEITNTTFGNTSQDILNIQKYEKKFSSTSNLKLWW